jgi:capsular exopolysaccharide synthesis family protein
MDLRDYLAVIRRRKGTIVLSALVVFAASLLFSFLQTPVYEGSARVLLQAPNTVFDTASGAQTQAVVRLSTEVQIIQSQPVQDLVRERLGVAPAASVARIGDTDVIEITAESTVPAQAAAIANTYAQAYIDFRLKQTVDSLLAAADQLQKKITDLQKPIDDLAAQAAAAAANARPGAPLPSTADRDALVSQQSLYKQKFDNLQVDKALKDGGAQVIAPAVTPTTPIRPRKAHNGALGLGVGVILGLGVAFLVDHLDDSIKSSEDLERAGSGVSVLGLIPAVPSWKNRGEPQVISITEPTSPAAEAYRTLRTSINFVALDRKLSLVQITSPSSAEGKTTTLANLALAMSKAGQTVIAFDCDLRKPRLHQFFGLPNEVGFTSVLVGNAPLATALQVVNPRLRVLTTGPRPTNPSELLLSNRAAELLNAVRNKADIVLIDCPPILPVTDAAALSSKVDGTVLVANAGSTSTKELAQALELLRRVEAPVIGAVLNGVTADSGYRYRYSYEYGAPVTNGSGNGSTTTNGRLGRRRDRDRDRDRDRVEDRGAK